MGDALHVYQNWCDTWVASSADDAIAQSVELYEGEPYSVEDFGEMCQLPDDHELELLSEDEEDGWERVERPIRTTSGRARTVTLWAKTMTCCEWAKGGRGHYGGGEGP